MYKIIFRLVLIWALALSSYSYAYNVLQGYIGASGVGSFQRVDGVHTTSSIEPALFTLDEITKFNINETVAGFSLVAGNKFLTFDPNRNDLSLRGEVEYSWYQKHDTKKHPAFPPPTVIDNFIDVEIQAQRAMFNLYLNKEFVNRMNFYGGGGIGAAFIHTNVQLYSDPDLFSKSNNTVNFAWSGIIGGNYHIYENINLNLAYSYVNFGSMKYGTIDASPSGFPGVVVSRKPGSDALTAQNVSLGLYYYL